MPTKGKPWVLLDAIAFGWTSHPIIMPFLMGWFLATISVLILVPTHFIQIVLLGGAIFFSISRMANWAKRRIEKMYVDLRDSGQYDELKELLMEEATKMANKNKGRVVIAHCNECQWQIFEDDSYFVDGPGDTYCINCCDDLEAQEKRKKEKTCMCRTCGAKFTAWAIMCNGENLGDCTGCCPSCADLGAPT